MPSLTPIVYAVIGAFALLGAIVGLARGFYKQTVRTITVVIAAILSFVAIDLFYSELTASLEGKTVSDIIDLLIENGVIAAETDTEVSERSTRAPSEENALIC